MKIGAWKTFLVPPRWLFLKIETDEGLRGWGEPVLEGRAQTVAVERLADYLAGKDASIFRHTDGYLRIPDGPEPGIEGNEEHVVERSKVGHRWRCPVWRHRDGGVPEW